jgi:hypothetical protein
LTAPRLIGYNIRLMDPLETYLAEIATLRGGTGETSGYPALANLLNAAGHTLKPKVRCVIHPKNSGAGIPDGGLFTPDQLKHRGGDESLDGLTPSRGVIEVKSAGEEIAEFADSEQVEKYLARYGLALLTNYRDFLLLKRVGGETVRLEGFQLASGEKSFWAAAAQPRKTAGELGERFAEYLKRVMLHNAPLNNPGDVAFFLASYARDARVRVEGAKGLPALAAVRAALEEALGMKFEAEKGEHFFRSTLVQTLFYGVFSAWVLWHKENPVRQDAFDWRSAAWTLHVPMIKALFYQVADPHKLGQLGLVEVLDWTAAALNRVERPGFFQQFAETHAVQYFYEPFLEAFDPELRKQLGVWYTPPEIVQYQVARVDAALREELGILDGLADPRVFVLDPCCGTGAYLVEVLKIIGKTLEETKGEGALTANAVKQAAQERIFGFELLPAPFVISHLQLGLLLQHFGTPLDDSQNERAAIYLTNALTGWEPATEEAKKQLSFAIPEFKQEKEAADAIKQEKRIMVILGNPPYNGYAGLAVNEEAELGNAYRATKRAPQPQGQGLNDLYVRFFRMAERRIVEKSGEGVISFISNYSWLDGLSFTGMREKYLDVFDSITIDCLNGDKYKSGKLTPDGAPDPSIFSTGSNREGIQVGTAIATLVRKAKHTTANEIHFRHLWGKRKRADLLESLGRPRKEVYETLTPPLEVGLPFLPSRTEADFFKWPLLTELLPVSFPGIKTSRDEALVAMELETIKARMGQYFDANISDEAIRRFVPALMEKTNRFDPKSVRQNLLQRGINSGQFVRFNYRPFDVRWLYWHPDTKLLDEKRIEFVDQVFPSNLFIEARQRQPKEAFDRGYVSHILCDNFGNGLSNFFPLFLAEAAERQSLSARETPDMFGTEGGGGGSDGIKPNLTRAAKDYLTELDTKPEALFFHIIAVLHSPDYRTENAGALRQDWPRVPLSKSRKALLASAELGRQVAALLDVETPVPGVTTGKIRAELKVLAVATAAPKEQFDFKITAGWGHAGQNGVTMPGKGKVVEAAVPAACEFNKARGKHATTAAYDIYLNDTACWRNVPEPVWEYTIGGYQVLKKWLSYREHALLGRPLTPDEAREFTHTARRIAALILLQPELDAIYQRVKGETFDWKP